jgi:hypothetical protein
VSAITVDDVCAVIVGMRAAGCSGKTIANALATLHGVRRFPRRQGWVVDDPLAELERGRGGRYPDDGGRPAVVRRAYERLLTRTLNRSSGMPGATRGGTERPAMATGSSRRSPGRDSEVPSWAEPQGAWDVRGCPRPGARDVDDRRVDRRGVRKGVGQRHRPDTVDLM